MDVKSTFLKGDLCEEIYMVQPLGFVTDGTSKLIWCLKKSLYEMKQSPNAWYEKIDKFSL
jgi:hypothetical protein